MSAIVTDGDVVWLVRHSYRPGLFLPGGAVKAGESFVDALRREVREELGIVVEGPIRPFGAYRHEEAGYIVVYEVTSWTGTPHAVSAEIDEVVPTRLDAVHEDTSPATRRRLDEWRSGSAPDEIW